MNGKKVVLLLLLISLLGIIGYFAVMYGFLWFIFSSWER